MKTKKIVLLKKAILPCALLIMILSGSAFVSKNNLKDKPQYCVAVGWEYMSNAEDTQPVISNIAHYDCTIINTMHVENELSSYYGAHYKKSRGSFGLKKTVAFCYDTKDQSIRKRRELFAEYNRDWNPLIIENFSIMCNE
jgi:hypothetical protein